MAATESIDPYLATALKLLHSSAPDSAEKLRTMLDNEISKTHDKSKLISNLLTKKQLNDEKTAPGSGFKKHKPKKPEEVKVVRAPSPEVIPIPDDDSSADESDSVMNDLMDLTDLTCVTCRNMDTSANNQLFECIECNLLHHQLCHVPKISNDTDLTTWICSTCKSKKEKEEGSSKSAKSYESSSSSSSHSNKKPTLNIVSSSEKKKVEVVKKKGKESSSSSSSSRSRSSRK